jgi:hypothetical protein
MALKELDFDPFDNEGTSPPTATTSTLRPLDFDPFEEPPTTLKPLDFDPFKEPTLLERAGEAVTLEQEVGMGGTPLDQNVVEFGKGVPTGAVSMAGSALKGAAALSQEGAYIRPDFQAAIDQWANLTPVQRNAWRQKAQRELDSAENASLQSVFEALNRGEEPTKAIAAAGLQGQALRTQSVAETELYKAGAAVQKFAEELAPAAPGYEDSVGRLLGEGLGTTAAGIGVSLLTGGASSAALFALAGAGETRSSKPRRPASFQVCPTPCRSKRCSGASRSRARAS